MRHRRACTHHSWHDGAPHFVRRPFHAQSSHDTLTAFKQNVVIDYRPSAGGNMGYGLVSKAPPDGYIKKSEVAQYAKLTREANIRGD